MKSYNLLHTTVLLFLCLNLFSQKGKVKIEQANTLVEATINTLLKNDSIQFKALFFQQSGFNMNKNLADSLHNRMIFTCFYELKNFLQNSYNPTLKYSNVLLNRMKIKSKSSKNKMLIYQIDFDVETKKNEKLNVQMRTCFTENKLQLIPVMSFNTSTIADE